MAEGLVPDRENARYTAGTIARQSEELDPPPAPVPNASPPVAVAPPRAAEKAIVEDAGPPKAGAQPPGPSQRLDGEPRYGVQLGAFGSRGRALRAMRSLTDAFKGIIDERLFAIDDSGKDGLSRVVLSGAFATRDAATAACVVVKERGTDCHVVRIR